MFDPFEQARKQYSTKPLESGLMSNPSFVAEPTIPTMAPEKPIVLSENTLNSLSKNAQTLDEQKLIKGTKIPEMMRKLGMDQLVGNLAFSPLGKIQLTNELRRKFGDNYYSNPQAKELLAAFDSHINSKEGKASMHTTLANAENTLSLLRAWSMNRSMIR